MAGQFQGKRILITGANRGIGLACAQGFAAAGARVALHYAHDADTAGRALHSLAGEGHVLFQAALDTVTGCRYLADQALAQLGGVDVLINNAGIFRHRRLDSMDFDEWQRIWDETLALNLSGPAHLSFLIGQAMAEQGQAMAEQGQAMAEQGQGRIINISSRGAFRGEPEAPAYGASKAGVNALTQSLAQALGPQGISVAAVAPGFVETDMTRELLNGPAGDGIRAQSPMGRVATPEDVAAAVLWLASDEAEFASGTIIDVNGASHLRQ